MASLGGAVPTASTNAPESADEPSSRLARKAASAREARARHKTAVANLEEEVRWLTGRVAELEAARLEAAQASSQALIGELKGCLPPDRWETLSGWLYAAAKEELPAAVHPDKLPPPEELLCALTAPRVADTPSGVTLSSARAQGYVTDTRNRRAMAMAAVRGQDSLTSSPLPAQSHSTPEAMIPVLSLDEPSLLKGATLRPDDASPTTVVADLLAGAMGIVKLASNPRIHTKQRVIAPRLRPVHVKPPPSMQPLPPPSVVPEEAYRPSVEMLASMRSSSAMEHAPLLFQFSKGLDAE